MVFNYFLNMRNLFKGFPTMLSNTKIEMKMEGWPATVSVLGICGVFITAILSLAHGIGDGCDDDE